LLTEEDKGTSSEEEKPSLLNDAKAEHGGAPEKYDAFTVPDGYEIGEETSKELDGLFRGLNLSQTQGQQLVDYYAAKSREASEAPYKLWEETRERWINEAKADGEIGQKLPQVRAAVTKMLDGLNDRKLTDAFKEAMDVTGAGNHPAFIKTFFRLAQRLTEGQHVSGVGPSPAGQRSPDARPASVARALYPDLP
jgi:hypothetical protein